MTSTRNLMCARERPWAVTARNDRDLLEEISRTTKGPFHIIHPQTFEENLKEFQRALVRRGVSGHVYFGKKANKAGAWLHVVARLLGSVDVASVPEFVHALANGVCGDSIGVTGAAKTSELLWLASQHRAVVAIDALDELERAIAIAAESRPLRILLRVLPTNNPDSRFGLNEVDLRAALARCAQVKQHVIMDGFSFHLDGYAVEPRAELAAILVDQCMEARKSGFPASVVCIGGGFACCYVEEDDWRSFSALLNPGQFHGGKTFGHFYPYFQAPTGSAMLDAILQSERGGITLASKLKAAQIQLHLEPGRALVDGSGMTVFPVLGFKRNAEHGIVTVAGLSMSLSEQWRNSEYLPTPFLVQCGPAREQKAIRVAVGGSSCMESDVLTWRKIEFPATPRYGDFIIYPNTAGYQMDKSESEFHQLALPPKIVVRRSSGRFIWQADK